ncbi:MAG: hypothetical protein SVR08_01315 [Spirochaetota bacterium]|nr:hypothetical protein [Spirochaetota bacterium]
MDYSLIGAVISGLGAIISFLAMFKTSCYKKEVTKIRDSILNQSNFTGFKDCSDIKDSHSNQINIK